MKISCSVNYDINKLQQASLSEAYALEAYQAIDAFYPKKDATTIKKNTTLTSNTMQIDTFLAQALFTGKDSYSLVPGLTSSPKAKVSSKGNKYLRVPIEKDTIRTVTDKSKGWVHPGFFKEFYEDWKNYINSMEIIELIIKK